MWAVASVCVERVHFLRTRPPPGIEIGESNVMERKKKWVLDQFSILAKKNQKAQVHRSMRPMFELGLIMLFVTYTPFVLD